MTEFEMVLIGETRPRRFVDYTLELGPQATPNGTDQITPGMLTSMGRLAKGLLSLVSTHSREPAWAVFWARFLGAISGSNNSSVAVAFRFLVEFGCNINVSSS
jgi:hypothetical protein